MRNVDLAAARQRIRVVVTIAGLFLSDRLRWDLCDGSEETAVCVSKRSIRTDD